MLYICHTTTPTRIGAISDLTPRVTAARPADSTESDRRPRGHVNSRSGPGRRLVVDTRLDPKSFHRQIGVIVIWKLVQLCSIHQGASGKDFCKRGVYTLNLTLSTAVTVIKNTAGASAYPGHDGSQDWSLIHKSFSRVRNLK